MEIVYDVETFPNLFTFAGVSLDPGFDIQWVFEISERRNEAGTLYITMMNKIYSRMYGYNNLAFDYPLLHYFFELYRTYGAVATGPMLANALYQHAQTLIAREHGWENHIRQWDMIVPQVDLLLINHFDNPAKMTSLKTLEFNIQSPSLEEMPYPVGHVVAPHEIPEIINYNINDVRETKRFAHKCMDAIKFREKLISDGTFGPECINWNDTKIGEKYFIKRLETIVPGITKRDANGRMPQTWRSRIALANVIVPYLHFERPETRGMLERLRGIDVDAVLTRDGYKHEVTLDGFSFTIGQGGIHGSVEKRIIRSTVDRSIIDIDVTGYYPSLAIANRFFPHHIGPVFCDVYREIRDDRAAAKKAGDLVKAGTLKLATNGTFGKTGSKHSVFYDPQCLLAITVNGQLLQVMLAEQLLKIPGLEVLQMNTDGLTVSLPRAAHGHMLDITAWWERQTLLELEFTEYEAMWLRDCNNYLAMDTKGKIKRKGEYDWEMLSGSTGGQKAWNRDFSALVVPKAAEAAFIHDQDPADFIAHHDINYDFLLRAKVTGASYLTLGHSGARIGKIVRYFISKAGEPLVKHMPPLKGKTEERRIGIHAEGQATAEGNRKNGYRCSMCGAPFTIKSIFDEHNKTRHAWPVTIKNQWDGDLTGIDHRWYVQRAEALLF